MFNDSREIGGLYFGRMVIPRNDEAGAGGGPTLVPTLRKGPAHVSAALNLPGAGAVGHSGQILRDYADLARFGLIARPLAISGPCLRLGFESLVLCVRACTQKDFCSRNRVRLSVISSG